MKALIAESNGEESDNMVMAFNLCFPDYELITADTGKQCLDTVKESSPDIIILGDLADMSGLDVLEQVRSFSEAPVMVVSQISDEPTVVKAFDIGADGYVIKPFHQLELMARLRAILRRYGWNIQAKASKDPVGGNQGC